MDVAGRPPSLQGLVDGATWSPTSPTSGTSPASPGRRACSSSSPVTSCWSPTAATRPSRLSSWRPRASPPRDRSAGPPREATLALVAAAGIERLGLEAAHVSWARQRALADWFPDISLVATAGVIEGLRRVKDPGEVARVARAAEIADAALASVRSMLAEGPTEVAFGQALDFEIRRLGATSNSFETIVGSGPNGAKPHHRPSSRRIGAPRVGRPRLRCLGRRLLLGHDPHCLRGRPIGGDAAGRRRGPGQPGGRRSRGQGGGGLFRGGPGVPGGHRGGGMGGRLRARDGARGGARHPRGTDVAFPRRPIHWFTAMLSPLSPVVRPAGIGRARIEDTVVVTDGRLLVSTRLPRRISVPANPQNVR